LYYSCCYYFRSCSRRIEPLAIRQAAKLAAVKTLIGTGGAAQSSAIAGFTRFENVVSANRFLFFSPSSHAATRANTANKAKRFRQSFMFLSPFEKLQFRQNAGIVVYPKTEKCQNIFFMRISKGEKNRPGDQ
jgi:hypothetical protein